MPMLAAAPSRPDRAPRPAERAAGDRGRPLEPAETVAAAAADVSAPPASPRRIATTSIDLRPEACRRCGGSHGGLCARVLHGAAATALAALGYAVDELERDDATTLRQRACAIVRGLVSPGGRDRERSIARCGTRSAVLVGDRVEVRPLYCGDRMCPPCQVRRSRKLAALLRPLVAHRTAESPLTIVFATLTQPKPRDLDPRVAVDLLLAQWRRLANPKTALGRAFRRRFRGGIRSVEVTYAQEGDLRSDGSRVPYTGWHAHLHLLLEVAGDDDVAACEWMVARWCDLTGAQRRGQHHDRMDDRRLGQLTKYVCKPLTDDCPDRVARRLAVALHGRRLHSGWGTWRAWRRDAEALQPREVQPPVAYPHWDHTGLPMRLADLVELDRNPNTRRMAVLWRLPGRREPVAVWSVGDVVDGLREHARRVHSRHGRHNEAEGCCTTTGPGTSETDSGGRRGAGQGRAPPPRGVAATQRESQHGVDGGDRAT